MTEPACPSSSLALSVLCLATLAAACIAEEASVLPAVPGVRSFAVIRDNLEGRDVFAFDVDDPDTLVVRLDSSAALPMYISFFGASLAELGLPSGRLEIAESGEQAYALPPSLQALEGVRAADGLEWKATTEAELAAKSTWIRGERTLTHECPEISVVSHVLPLGREAKRWITVAEHLGDGRVLIASQDGEWMISTRDSIERVRSLTASVAHGSSFRDRDGRIWLAQCEVEGLYSMNANLEVDRLIGDSCGSWTSSGQFVVRMDGAPPDQPNELVTMSRSGRVVLYDQDRVGTELYNLTAQVILQFVAWDEPGRAVVTFAEPEILMVERGTNGELVRPDWASPGDPPDFYRARRSPQGLLLAGEDGTGNGLVMIRDRVRGAWYALGRTGEVGPVLQVVPTVDGFAYAGSSRQLGWWTPEAGFCSAAAQGPNGPDGRPTWELGSYSFYVVVPVSDDEFFVAGFVSLSETSERIWWVRRQR